MCAVPRFEKPRSSLKKVLIVAVRSCHCGELIRGLENLEAPCKGKRFYSFCVVQKEPKSTPEVCEPLDSGDDSKLCRKWFCKNFRGTYRNRFCPQNAGEKALNRCERVTVVQTQDRCFSKMDYCTASSQRQAIFEKGCCTLVWVLWEIGVFVR